MLSDIFEIDRILAVAEELAGGRCWVDSEKFRGVTNSRINNTPGQPFQGKRPSMTGYRS